MGAHFKISEECQTQNLKQAVAYLTSNFEKINIYTNKNETIEVNRDLLLLLMPYLKSIWKDIPQSCSTSIILPDCSSSIIKSIIEILSDGRMDCSDSYSYLKEVIEVGKVLQLDLSSLLASDFLPKPSEPDHIETRDDFSVESFLIELEENSVQDDIIEMDVNVPKKEYKFKCQLWECNFKCSQKNGLISHMTKVHQCSRLFCCEQCNFLSNTKKDLNRHMVENHYDSLHNCQYCDHKALSLPALGKHIRRTHPSNLLNCDQCDFAAIDARDFERHKKRFCKSVKAPEQHLRPLMNLKIYECEKCLSKFDMVNNLIDHQQICQENVTSKDLEGEDGEVHECEECMTQFKGLEELVSHKRNVHKYNDKEKVNCESHDPETSIFIGGLGQGIADNDLKEHFQQFGKVLDSCIKRFPNGVSKEFGFVTFASFEQREKSIAANPHRIGDKLLKVTAVMKDRRPQVNRLYVGGLTHETHDSDLKAYFGKFGMLTESCLRGKGFGYISFATSTQAAICLNHKPHVIDGKVVIVERHPKRLFVSGIPEHVGNKDLKDYFDTFGEVISAEKLVKMGMLTNKAFVQFNDDQDDLIEKIVSVDSHVVKGVRLEVQQDKLPDFKDTRMNGDDMYPLSQHSRRGSNTRGRGLRNIGTRGRRGRAGRLV